MKTLLLGMKDVEAALSMKTVIDAVEEGYLAYHRGKVRQPEIVSIEMPENNGETDIKSCYNEMNERISVKVASGFYNNGKQNNLFKGAKIVNDSIPQCVSRGETRNAILAGVIKKSDIHGEIGQLLAGEKPLREHEDEITIFDTTGMGIQDNVTAVMVYERAFQESVRTGKKNRN